ncbi:MAG TPA: hypothetical protein VHO23_02395, partial [Candidatus Paceibacterota bacterium]|nr:hypothetical protein [Candidatus Paceibacterota bacterium]
MTTSRPASPIAGLILVLSVVVAVIVAQPAPLLGGTASCSYTGTSWDGVNFISNDYYSNLTPAQRAAIEAAMAPCPLTWNGPFSSTASYSCSGGTVGGDVPGGGPPQAATCNVTVMVPTAEPPGSCQTCAQMGYDTGTSPTNYPSCSNGSCRNYTCQDYGYNYGTLGCCYNNANHSDDACYDACPSITGNQPVGYNCSIGQSCTSSANACGQTGSGTIQSNGQCSATTPANPAGYGNSCQSSANSCGMTNTGTIQCNGSCSASAPSNSSCPIDVCSNIGGVQTSVPSGYYASGGACYPNPTDLCDNIAGTQTSVPSGYYQSGSSCYPNPIDVCPTTPGTQTQTSQC